MPPKKNPTGDDEISNNSINANLERKPLQTKLAKKKLEYMSVDNQIK